jgi:hypothetical protein
MVRGTVIRAVGAAPAGPQSDAVATITARRVANRDTDQ